MMSMKWLGFLLKKRALDAYISESGAPAQTDTEMSPCPGLLPIAVLSICLLGLSAPADARQTKANGYVGSASCQSCHESQYQSFQNYARKSRSFESVQRMAKGLTQEEIRDCYACHTTGYGEPGGFVSPSQTPELKEAGCEVCHGPGKRHVETQNPDHILRVVTIDVCQKCHTEDRVQSFRYTPVIHAGCH